LAKRDPKVLLSFNVEIGNIPDESFEYLSTNSKAFVHKLMEYSWKMIFDGHTERFKRCVKKMMEEDERESSGKSTRLFQFFSNKKNFRNWSCTQKIRIYQTSLAMFNSFNS
jgi:hypothetical protein